MEQFTIEAQTQAAQVADENDPFTDTERSVLVDRLDALHAILNLHATTLNLHGRELAMIQGTLDDLKAGAERLGRKDYLAFSSAP